MIIRNRSKTQKLTLAAAIFGVLQAAASTRTSAATLPVPCAPGSCGTWVTSGTAGAVQFGNTLTVNQTSDRAIFNWQSFNISADGKVTFIQPDSNSIALNKIFDKNPSEIFGKLEANGQLYLYNQNGFLFGATARVNTGGLLASSLNISDVNFNNGLLSALSLGKAAMEIETAGITGNIVVEPGAQLITNAAGQRVMLAANKIDNQGNITANDGQVILAAGEKVYLSASDDPKLRGLLVEIDGGGTVNNTGTVTAERGNITAVGLAVNQNGRMTATTSVASNGSIRLLARHSTALLQDDLGNYRREATRGGDLHLGDGSVTEVNPDAGDEQTAVREQDQFLSRLELVGKKVEFASGSNVVAAGGELSVIAASDFGISRSQGIHDPEARVRVDAGAIIDLSGSTANTSVARNLVTVELRANELADSPLQRDGALRGKTVVVDARVLTANGNRGTDIGDVKGAIDLIGQDVLERTSKGGTATFDSAGDIVVAKGATIDVSGGAVNYAGGMMRTTQVIKADGTVLDIGKANKDEHYVALVNPLYKLVSDRWGVVRYISAPGLNNYEPGYVEGADAGTIQFMGSAMALSGNFLGTAINGANQRTIDTMARGGELIVGVASPSSTMTSFRAPTVNLVSTVVPIVVGEDASLPAALPLYLATDFISQGGFSRLQLASDNRIVIAANTPINLSAGGSITLAAPHVEINSDISAPSGTIRATALNLVDVQPSGSQAGLFVGDHVSLDARGLWVNDAAVPIDQLPTASLLTKGGTIVLTQAAFNGTLQVGDDVALRASGGAWMKRSGAISGGAGGGITIGSVSGINSGVQTMLAGENLHIDGYGVQGAAGGSLTLRAPRIEIAESDSWLSEQQVSTDTTAGGTLQMGSSLFSDYGFANVSLTADNLPLLSDPSKTVLRVNAGAQINLSQQTLQLDDSVMTRLSTTHVAEFAAATNPLEYQARAGTLRLQALTALPNPESHGDVLVESGATVTGNSDSTINLASNGSLRFGGAIDIASGSVDMRIVKLTGEGRDNYVDRQLTIDSAAKIDVGGAVILRPNELGLRQGTVLDGGTVALIAERGSVDIKSGSLIDVTGTQSELDTKQPGASEYVRRDVASVAGSVSIQAEETIAMQGDLQAWGGVRGASNTGGSLSVALTRVLPSTSKETYPAGPRVVQVTNKASPIDEQTIGIASLDAQKIAQSGIESLVLRADDRIAIGAGVSLQLNRGLILDAPGIAVLGSGVANLAADYISIGSKVEIASTTPIPQSSSGDGQLSVQANDVDLVGWSALQGMNKATFASTGDITLQGYGSNVGKLAISGDLTLRAQRVLPSTGSKYTISAVASDSTVSIEQVGGSPGTPWSVGGSLTIAAPHIVQGGTIMAPFGSINLNAGKSLQLARDSYTSVSANGAVLPYGRVDNGKTWLDATGEIHGVSAPRVTLTAASNASIDMDASAIVDISGGGDWLAYQYTPGTGGKQDVLDPNSAGRLKDTYAIVPALAGQAAAYDPLYWSGSNIAPGASIYIAGGSEIPAGVYQLLPARYALAPGAYLVSALPGYQDLRPGITATTPDGATVVSGYYSFGNQENAAARTGGFAIRPGSYVRTLAQYESRLASTFFPAQAQDASDRARLPSDAGALIVGADQSLRALGIVRGQAASGGINATVEIAAKAIEIDANTSALTEGVHLSSALLKDWHVGSLLLGGTRTSAGAVTIKSESVVVHGGANLSADEVVLVAGNSIGIEAGANVGSTSDTQVGLQLNAARFSKPTSLNLTGSNAASAAVLAVSDLSYLVTERNVAQSNTGATITVASGAHVGTRGAVAVDGSGVISLASNSISADGASWSLGSNHVAFGEASTAADGLAIDSSLQANLQTARAINLSSARTLDLTRSVALGGSATDSITLKAARLQNTGDSTTSSFTAKNILLNGVNAQAGVVAQGNGVVAFNAQRIEVGKGELGLSGFASTDLNSTGLVVGSSTGGIVTSGNLNVASNAITAASGAQTSLKAAHGAITLSAVGTAPDAKTLQTGGTLSIVGRDITDSANIIVPSGVVTLQATNTMSVQDGATIDVAGYRPTLAAMGSNGGAITLDSTGSLTLASGTSLKVAAGPQADAGSINVIAGTANFAGTIVGNADQGYDGGEFTVIAQSLTDFAALNRTLEQGGFTEQRSYRVKSGDLKLAATDRITAQQIALTADAGGVAIDGQLIAASDEQRSSIAINARNNVTIGSGALIDASAIDMISQRGGSIELATTAGHIQIASSANIRAQGKNQSGSLTLRASATATDFNLDSLPSNLTNVDNVVLEPIKNGAAYELVAAPSSAAFDAIRDDLNTYVTGARSAILNRLQLNSATNVYLRPYADMTRTGDLVLSDYDFAQSNWRFAGQPAVVSIRATGNLSVTGSFSDGFVEVNGSQGPGLDLLGTPNNAVYSSTFNLVAGADLNSAAMTATQRFADPTTAPDLLLNDGAIVRTGTGDISLAAARDILIGQDATVYTGGIAGANTVNDDDGVNIFPEKGGSIQLLAGRDVVGKVVRQVPGDWQSRWAYYEEFEGQVRPAYWGVDASQFRWNVGALGGGDVRILAGRNAIDISAAVVDTAANNVSARLELGGGNLSVTAGKDIQTGYFYVAKGLGDLRAWGGFGLSGHRASPTAGTLLLAGDASYKLGATGDVVLQGEGQVSMFEPTRFSALYDNFFYFSRYSDDTVLAVQSTGGKISISSDAGFTDLGVTDPAPFRLYPASVRLNAFGGDVSASGSFVTSPSAIGNLDIYAARDIAGSGLVFSMSDVDTSQLPGSSATNVAIFNGFPSRFENHSEDVLHQHDATSSHIAAGRDISNVILHLAEASEVQAGRDVRDLSLDAQQFGAATTSTVIAGRDLYYTAGATNSELRVGGTGLFEILAGRNIDLGSSKGITTVGNLLNPNLPSQEGASIIAIAGLNSAFDGNGFVNTVVGESTDLQARFVAYMEKLTNRTGLSFATASAAYAALPTAQQLPFAIDALFAELVAAGREANIDATTQFERGYTALASLFARNNGVNAYSGDLSLPFSRIYTLSGGSISLLTPGGKIDVGLANPPTNLSGPVTLRTAADLGIVAQQAGDVHIMADKDVLVNTSRIFTLGGGSIAIWSSTGNIDAGKGAKSAISAPPPTLSVDNAGNVSINIGSAIAGSGIRTILTSADIAAGDVDLIAPAGFVNAGDAGIGSAGNLNIAAQRVVGLDNIQVGGTSSGVPPETGGLGASLSGVTANAGNATTNAANAIGDAQATEKTNAVLADAAMSWLEVFVVGLGEENCKQDDIDCLKRQK